VTTEKTGHGAAQYFAAKEEVPWANLRHDGWRVKRMILSSTGVLRELKLLRAAAVQVLVFRECIESNRPGMSHVNDAVRFCRTWQDKYEE